MWWMVRFWAATIQLHCGWFVGAGHIIVPGIHDEDQVYLLQNHDGRVIFVIPYEGDFSSIAPRTWNMMIAPTGS